MKSLRVIARALVIDNGEILLARNKGANFWYPPGGGWEYETETITEGVVREVYEESGYRVGVDRLLWVQEFHDTDQKILLESFWLTHLEDSDQPNAQDIKDHVDLDPNGAVEEVRWYNSDAIQKLTVFPKRVKDYQQLIAEQLDKTDPFIGVFK